MRELSPPRRWFFNLAPVRWVWGWLYHKGWPAYECIDCIGVGCGYYHACYCAHHDAVGPCEEPGESHEWARWLHGFLFTQTSPFWRERD